MKEYITGEITEVEQKWQRHWESSQLYRVKEDVSSPKYYVLDMFPYPSGAGLHVGHPLGYIASDIVARFKRLKGFNVLHPIGFDAFGLPAEQYAIQTGQHPAITTQKNEETYRRQLRRIGLCYDWSREVQTSDPDFYRWTQWIFIQLFNSWYNLAGNKTEHIDSLITEFGKNGNAKVRAVCDEETPVFSADDWAKHTAAQKEEMLQMYRIAYRSESIVNWCPGLGTVLSNDEVKDGVSERGGYPVERIKMWQWSMRISAYAERLLEGLETIDWPEPLKEMQRNWIGKSIGAELSFKINGSSKTIPVFTTRLDTIFGVTFLVLAPEHPFVSELVTDQQHAVVREYIDEAINRSERDRMSEVKRVSGVFTGTTCEHPFTGKPVPIWVADYVLAGYGTGAVMGVPSNDTRDYAFATHFGLEIIPILEGPTSDITSGNFEPKSGSMINSDFLNGLPWEKAIEAGLDEIEKRGIGKRKINYRLRDAIFGRQRYWGEPFPVYYENGIPRLVKEEDLPITLPEVDKYQPTEKGDPPLGRAKNWAYTSGGIQGPFELTTMPGWAGSSWYWFRYMDPHNNKTFCSREAQHYWKDVDLYVGGSEHATGHLLYSRFWCKALHDLGHVEADEPFKKLINQGHIQGVSKFVYRFATDFSAKYSSPFGSQYDQVTPTIYVSLSLAERILDRTAVAQDFAFVDAELAKINSDLKTKYPNAFFEVRLKQNYSLQKLNVDIDLVNDKVLDIDRFKKSQNDLRWAEFILEEGKYFCGSEVEKMSKSKHNVVNPDDIIEKYGADTLRLYEMFLGPIELSKPWNTNGIDGVYRFLRKFWNLFHDDDGKWNVTEEEPGKEELRIMHRTIKKVEDDIEKCSFNTSVSEFMICANELGRLGCRKRAILEPLTIALAPFAPHLTEEVWQQLGHKDSVHKSAFPAYDESYLTLDSYEYPISINGKVRAKMEFALDMPREDIEKLVLASEAVVKWTGGKQPKKVIVVPGRIVNVVL